MNPVITFLDKFGASLERHAVPRPVGAGAPRELHLELTYRCNTACVMCNLRYLQPGTRELSAGEIERFVSGSRLLRDLELIVLSGGEPWLREDFPSLASFFRRTYPSAGLLVLSNLFDADLISRRLDALGATAEPARLSIGSSLDGVGDVHDRVRGRAGSFLALERTLDLLGKRFPGIDVSFNFTLTPENAGQMGDVFSWCADRGRRVTFQVLVQKEETKTFSWSPEQLDTVDEQLERLIGRIADGQGVRTGYELLADEGLLSRLLSLRYIGAYVRSPKRYFPNCPCGERFAMIDPSGNVGFCPVLKRETAGSVRSSSFDAVWRSAPADRARALLNGKRCHCWLTCTYGLMLGDAIASGKTTFVREHFSRGAGGR